MHLVHTLLYLENNLNVFSAFFIQEYYFLRQIYHIQKVKKSACPSTDSLFCKGGQEEMGLHRCKLYINKATFPLPNYLTQVGLVKITGRFQRRQKLSRRCQPVGRYFTPKMVQQRTPKEVQHFFPSGQGTINTPYISGEKKSLPRREVFRDIRLSHYRVTHVDRSFPNTRGVK